MNDLTIRNFKCDICSNTKMDHLYTYSPYNGNTDTNQYCEKCMNQKEENEIED